jgi:hypothetical protein
MFTPRNNDQFSTVDDATFLPQDPTKQKRLNTTYHGSRQRYGYTKDTQSNQDEGAIPQKRLHTRGGYRD